MLLCRLREALGGVNKRNIEDSGEKERGTFYGKWPPKRDKTKSTMGGLSPARPIRNYARNVIANDALCAECHSIVGERKRT
jgi:hypothetical protein